MVSCTVSPESMKSPVAFRCMENPAGPLISRRTYRIGGVPTWDSCTAMVRDVVVEETSEGWRGAPGRTVCVCVCACVCVRVCVCMRVYVRILNNMRKCLSTKHNYEPTNCLLNEVWSSAEAPLITDCDVKLV